MFEILDEFEPMNLNSSNSDALLVTPEYYIVGKFGTLKEGMIVKIDRTT